MPRFVNHWERGAWPSTGSVLHWYILPPADVHASTTEVQRLVARPELRAVPSIWLHCTVVLLGPTSMLDSSGRAELLAAGAAAVACLGPFAVAGRATFGPQACTWQLEPVEAITEVFDRIMHASARFFPGLAARHYSPHISFAYSHQDGDACETVEALGAAPRLDPFEVRHVHLLEVFREPGPQRGWYRWAELGAAPLLG